eukprot:gnl/MRDRNA2_/MRDRNA2_132578_c0_seq1.p1 gnl/MRDRNA2_/MRDRNA2_132578_c0~~gnl/MRDRNA2_/MRDRNA2_132578_c0_seq1.p1  ORF type:complete len:315 (+),score=59.19 gnl/MRDRNA2_/MRDRNA2_132578_c0_seq1:81-1025(+)
MCVTPFSEGESRRNSYISAFCRTMEGLSFSEQSPGECLQPSRSSGAYRCRAPSIVGKLRAGSSAASTIRAAGSMYSPAVPEKVTLPGPMTIAYTIDSTWALSTGVYSSRKEISQDLIPILRQELVALVEAGCNHIQLDEPVFPSRVTEALEIGVKSIEEIFESLPKHVAEHVSLRCGQAYSESTLSVPMRSPSMKPSTPPQLPMDWESPESDFDLGSPALDIQAVQPLLRAKTVTVGAVRVRRCSANAAEEIEAQLEEALQQFGSPLAHRTVSDEDCGLGMMDPSVWESKMHRLCQELDRIKKKHLSIPEVQQS